jgi:hypothetical protein
MPVENIYWNFASRFYAWNTTGSWSLDIDMPAQTVYATASLSSMYVEDTPGYLFCGVLLYWRLISGVPIPVLPPVTNNNVAPAIRDDDVVTVAFLYGAGDAIGDCNFLVLGYG